MNDNSELIKDYINGMTLNDVCKKYHHKYSTVKKILEENEIHRRTLSEISLGKNKKKISQEIENAIIDNYVNKGYGLIKSGQEFGITSYIVKRILKDNNIHIRDYGEAAVISNINRKKYNTNDNYFQNQSHNMAWILGFLASDGSVGLKNNTIKIGLSDVDKEILEKIKEEIGLENPIREFTNSKGYKCAELTWTCQQHKEDLAKYSIVPQKTFTLKPPYKLERKYWIDYIRGYFDGDGSINYIISTQSIRWQVCSATKDILKFIVNFLYDEYDIPKVSILSRKSVNYPIYYFQYSTQSAKKIYNVLYTPDSLALKRKKDHFDNLYNGFSFV